VLLIMPDRTFPPPDCLGKAVWMGRALLGFRPARLALGTVRSASRRNRAASTAVSGITGVGGGIFLAPLVLSFGWVETRRASAVSTVFNLLNSSAALAGAWATIPAFPALLPWWLVSVGLGAVIGSWLGAHHLPPKVLRVILAVLLLVSGLRMVLA
jgi:uncharacterized membrane protein YfcA